MIKNNNIATLVVTELGDASVGIYPQSWEIQCPVYISDIGNLDKHDISLLNEFKHDILNLYAGYCEFGISADYIHDLKKQID